MPTIVDATWVPCPTMSAMPSLGTKLWVSLIWVERSGWLTSTPVSSSATVTPVPSYPAAQASGAPICGTLSWRFAFTLPSSHSFAMPSSRVGVGSVRSMGGVTEFQNVRTCGLAEVRAAPRTDGRRRTRVLPWGALGVLSARVAARV